MECVLSAENTRLSRELKEMKDNRDYWRKLFAEQSEKNRLWADEWFERLGSLGFEGKNLEERAIAMEAAYKRSDGLVEIKEWLDDAIDSVGVITSEKAYQNVLIRVKRLIRARQDAFRAAALIPRTNKKSTNPFDEHEPCHISDANCSGCHRFSRYCPKCVDGSW